jgi:hypothetical protein
MRMKRQIAILEATPSKRMFLSIIADYDLSRSICELVDNGFDVWTRLGRASAITIDVLLDEERKLIVVEDNAGGLPRGELQYIVGPGQSGSSPTDETIGIFGVGTKRAVVALAEEVRITTRYGVADTYQIEFDDKWLGEEEWSLPLYEVDQIDPGTTRVELQRLRLKIDEDAEKQLRNHLGATYARFLDQEGVTLRLNGQPVEPRYFDNWSYPPDYLPRLYHGHLEAPNGSLVSVEVLAGLSSESSPTSGEYGVYFYCNDRLVAPAMKSFDVGFTKGQAGLPHPKISLTKVIVMLRGEAAQMPWNSSKSDISTKHHIFVALHDWLVTVVKDYAAVSRAWEGQWPDKVFAFPSGEIVDTPIADFLNAKRSFLPEPPASKPRLAERVSKMNQRLALEKPWTATLFEGVVAAKSVAKQSLVQANWLAFNLLELTLVTTLKEYLVHESKAVADELPLRDMLTSGRIHQLSGMIPLSASDWTAIGNLMTRREELYYGRSMPTIANNELRAAERLVESVLNRLFGIVIER